MLVFPVQAASLPAIDPQLKRWPADRAAVDAEIAYWFQQGTPTAKWLLPQTIDRTIQRSPTLDINPRALAVGAFQHAQVRRIGDPLFGDLARLAAVLQARIAIVPVAAEFVGVSPDSAVLSVATAVIDPTDGAVIWFGVITGKDKGAGSAVAIASAAQTFARTFAGHQPGLEINEQ